MKKKAFTLIELMLSISLMLLALVGFEMLFLAGLRSTLKTNASAVITQQNALGIRKITQTLNEALSATISENNTRIDFVLPAKSTLNDTVTGQREYMIPLTSDGVSRYFRVLNGNLLDSNGHVLVRDISTIDYDPNSSQYNQTYQPFQFTTIGGTRAVTINFVTSVNVGTRRYVKMKSTVLLRNSQ